MTDKKIYCLKCGKLFENQVLNSKWWPYPLCDQEEDSEDINKPEHYTKGGIEVLDFIKAKLSTEEYRGFLIANILKYVSRAPLKGGIKDYKKAQFYLNKLVEMVDAKKD